MHCTSKTDAKIKKTIQTLATIYLSILINFHQLLHLTDLHAQLRHVDALTFICT